MGKFYEYMDDGVGNDEEIEFICLHIPQSFKSEGQARALVKELIEAHGGDFIKSYPNAKKFTMATFPERNPVIEAWFVEQLKGKLPLPIEVAENDDGETYRERAEVIEALREFISDLKSNMEGPERDCGCPYCQMRRARSGEPEPENYAEGRTPRECAEQITKAEQWDRVDEVCQNLRRTGQLPDNYPDPSTVRADL